jgi:hypothetical protein
MQLTNEHKANQVNSLFATRYGQMTCIAHFEGRGIKKADMPFGLSRLFIQALFRRTNSDFGLAQPCNVIGYCFNFAVGQARSDGNHLCVVLANTLAVSD